VGTWHLTNTPQKTNYHELFLYSEKQNNWKTTTGQKFRRGQKFRLTPDPKLVLFLPETGVCTVFTNFIASVRNKHCWIAVASMVAGDWTGVGFSDFSKPGSNSKTLEQERSLKMWFRPPLLPSWLLSVVCSCFAKFVWLPD